MGLKGVHHGESAQDLFGQRQPRRRLAPGHPCDPFQAGRAPHDHQGQDGDRREGDQRQRPIHREEHAGKKQGGRNVADERDRPVVDEVLHPLDVAR